MSDVRRSPVDVRAARPEDAGHVVGVESAVDAIRRWEKRVVITDVSFDDSARNKDLNQLPVIISYRVIQTQVEGNLVYPFFRELP